MCCVLEVVELKKDHEYSKGLKKGVPIALGYLSVSLTFGMLASRGGMSPLTALLISMTNLTSAGQFAGIEMIFVGASYFEIALTTFVINIRYMLMSLSLSQKVENGISKGFKSLIAFGITDETYAVASIEDGELSLKYMLGLITLPYCGWALGTFLGAISTSFMPERLQDALGIALYGMFIAIIIPEAKRNKSILIVIIIAIGISCLFKYFPYLNNVSAGFAMIITSVVAAAIGAKILPLKEVD